MTAALLEVLAATGERCRDAEVPPEPFRGDLLAAAVACGEDVASLAHRIVVANHDHAGDPTGCRFCAPAGHKHPPSDPKPPAQPPQPPTPPPDPRDVAAAAVDAVQAVVSDVLAALDELARVAHGLADPERVDACVAAVGFARACVDEAQLRARPPG